MTESPLSSPLIPQYEPPDPAETLPAAAQTAASAGVSPDEHHRAAVQSQQTGMTLQRPIPGIEERLKARRLASLARANRTLAEELSEDPVAAVAAAEHADELVALDREARRLRIHDRLGAMTEARAHGMAQMDRIEKYVMPRTRTIPEALEFGLETQIELSELGLRAFYGEDPGPLLARAEWIEQRWAGTEEASGLMYFVHRSLEQSPQWWKGQESAIRYGLSALGMNHGISLLSAKHAGKKAINYGTGKLLTGAKTGPIGAMGTALYVAQDIGRSMTAFGAGYAYGGAVRTWEMYTGSAYLEMLRLTDKDGNRIDPSMARAIAAVVGAVNAPLGAAQIANVGDMLGGRVLRGQYARRFGRALLGNETLRQRLFGIAERLGKDITLQAASEFGQEFVAGLGAELSMILDESFGEPADERQNVVARAWDSSMKAAASAVLPGSFRAMRSVPGAIIDARQASSVREANRALGEMADGMPIKNKSPEILERWFQSRGADSILIADGRNVQELMREKGVAAELEKAGITPEMVDESAALGHGIRFHSAKLMANVRNDVAQRLLDRSRLLGSRMLLKDATPEATVSMLEQDAERLGNIADQIDNYNRRLGLVQKQIAKTVEQSALLGRQAAAQGVRPSDYASQIVRLLDSYAKRQAFSSGEDLNAILSRLVIRYARRGEDPKAVQERFDTRPKSVSRRIGEGPQGHDILNTMADIGPMRRPGKADTGGEFDAIREGQTRLQGPYSSLLATEGMGADQMAQALQAQGIGDGTTNTMWTLVDEALAARRQARTDAAEGAITDLGEAEAAGLVAEADTADDVPFATDDLFEGLTEEDLATGMRDMVDDLGTALWGEEGDGVTMFQAVPADRAPMADTIEIDGVQRPTTNSEGQRIHGTEEGVRNFWKWFGASRVVDEHGRPLVVYHGSESNIDVFRKNENGMIFFALDRNYASIYGSVVHDAYIRSDSPLSILKWDATDDVSMESWRDFLNESGVDTEGLRLTDGEPLQLISQHKDGLGLSWRMEDAGYDSIRLNEYYEGEGESESIAVFGPTQIKSATGNTGAFDRGDPSILHQAAVPRLAALHNISAEGLAFADEIGGLAVPSIGITPEGQGFEGFGEITLLGDRRLADPRMVPAFDADAYTSRFPRPVYSKAKVKDADRWSKDMMPFAERFEEGDELSNMWDALVNRSDPGHVIHRMMSSLFGPAKFLAEEKGIAVDPVMKQRDAFGSDILADEQFMAWMQAQDWAAYNSMGYANSEPVRAEAMDQARAAWKRVLPDDPGLAADMARYWESEEGSMSISAMDKLIRGMRDFGQETVDHYATKDAIRSALEPHAAEFKSWVEASVLPLVGEPRVEVGRKKLPYTLDNIVEAMTRGRGVRGQEQTMTFGEGAARAAAARQFDDLEQMRRAVADDVRSEEEVAAARERTKELMDQYRDLLIPHYKYSSTWDALDGSMRAIAKWAKGKRTAARLRTALASEDFVNVPDIVIEAGVEAGNAFLSTPVPYFEAKPQRGVALDEFPAAVIPATASDAVRATLEKHGIAVFEHDGTPEGKQRAIQAAQRSVPQTLFQGTSMDFEQRQRAFDEKPRGSMTIASDRYLIEVFENANMSTILHELGHVFLEETRSLIDAGLAGEQTQKDWTTLQEWMGGDWSAMTLEQKVAAHEKFARAFEQYLMEGKAPSLALERPFSRFREWLLAVYRSAQQIEAEAGQELNLNDEIRGVMDRMIATEEAIHEARIVNGQTRVTGQEFRHLNLTPEEQSELDELLEVAFEAGKSRVVQDREADLPGLMREWRAEARQRIEASEEQRTFQETKRGGGLNAEDVRVVAGQQAVNELRRRGLIAKGNEGRDPAALAGRYGLEDGAAFVQQLANTPNVNKAIAAEVQSRVSEYMSAIPVDEAMIDTDAHAAAMDKVRDLIASRHDRGRDAVKVRAEAIRELARVRMENMSIERILDTQVFSGDYQRHTTEERNLLRKAATEPSKVDRSDIVGQALAAHDRARLAMEMLRIAREIRHEIDMTMKTVKLAKGRPSKTRQARGMPHRIGYQWRENILHLANRAGLVDEKVFVQGDRQPLAAILPVDDPIHEMGPEFSPVLMDDAAEIPYTAMTMDEWRDLYNLVEHLKHRGIQEVKDEVFRGQVKREELVSQLQESLGKHKDKWTWNENNPLRKVVNFVDGLLAGRLQLLYILRAADGYTNLGLRREAGPFENQLYDRIERAYDVEQRTMESVRQRLAPHLGQLERSIIERPHVLDLPVPFPDRGSPAGVQRNWTFERLVSVALNCGNRYQLDALARGYGWGEMVVVDEATGRQEWQTDMATIEALLGSLSAADLRAVQGIWNAINSLWGQLSAVHKRRFGFAPVKVDASPITVTASDGTVVEMDGGYYPMMFDRSIDRRHEQQQAAEDLLVSNTNLLPTAKTYSGFMTERINSGGKPIRLDLGVLIEHLSHTAKYIAYTETLLDIAKVLQDGRFSDPVHGLFIKKFGANVYNQIMPALADTARVSREHKDAFDRIFDWARGNATRYMLGLNPQTAVRQLSATIPGIERVGAGNYLAGLLRVISNPMEAVRYMRQESTVMRARWQSQDREVQDQIRSVKGKYNALWRIGRKMGLPDGAVTAVVFGAVQVMDYITATPVWYGSYRRAVHDGQSHEQAVLTANKDVVDTQSMARPFDLSAYQRSQKGYVRLFTSFMTFLMRSGNQAWLYDRGLMAGKIKPTTYARYFIINRIAQPLLELMLLDLAQGRIRGLLDGDEEDWRRYSFTALQWQFIGMPGIRELVDAAAYRTGGVGFQPRGLPSPSFVPWDLLDRVLRDLPNTFENDESFDRALMSLAHFLSFSSGIPAARLYDRLNEGMRQYSEEVDADLRNILWPNPDLRRRGGR